MSTNISQCFGVRSLSYRSNQGIQITKIKQNMEETRIPHVLQPTDNDFSSTQAGTKKRSRQRYRLLMISAHNTLNEQFCHYTAVD